VVKSLIQIEALFEGVNKLVNGLNCSVVIKKGLGSVLATMCSFDPDNFSMLSSLLEISFYQLIVTILAMFGVCCGCFYRHLALNFDEIDEEDKKS